MAGEDVSSLSSKSSVSGGGVLRAASVMGAATFLSRILGLVREQVFAFLFGAGNVTDAYNIAFRIPNLLRDLFAEGAMSSALVPTFTQVREKEGERRAWRVAGLIFRVLFIAVSLLAVIGVVFAPTLVGLYAGAFSDTPGKFELTVELTRVLFPFFPMVALAAAFMGILNACGKFFVPAFSSALFNLVSIISGVALVYFAPDLGIQPITGMAIGVVLGGLIQAASQIPLLRESGYRWIPRSEGEPVWHRDPALKKMLMLMAPATLGLAATQINILVNSVLSTSQGPGAVSWLNYSFRLLQFPIGIFGVSLAVATLPRFSQLWVRSERTQASQTLESSLKHVIAINLPASVGLAVLGVPIVGMLFEYGRFTAADTLATASALAAYAVGLTAYSAVKILVPVFYALGNTRIPVISSLLSVGLTIVLNLLMVERFGYWGLALGTSIAALVNAGFLYVWIQRLLGQFQAPMASFSLLRAIAAQLLVSALMGAACYSSSPWLSSFVPDSALESIIPGTWGVALIRVVRVGILILEGVVVLILAARLLGAHETTEIVGIFKKKLKKKLS